MSRGHGVWQRYVLKVLEEVEPNGMIPVADLFMEGESRSVKESIRRAVRVLADRGEIHAGEGWIETTVNGHPTQKIGLFIAHKDSYPIPPRRSSYRSIAKSIGGSHNTVARAARDIGL